MLGIVGLPWPEDTDCAQFPEDGGDTSCLLPDPDVDGESRGHSKPTQQLTCVAMAVHLIIYHKLEGITLIQDSHSKSQNPLLIYTI